MKILKSLLFLVFVCQTLSAQIYQPIVFPEKIDKKYIFDPLKEQEKYSKKLKKSLPKKELENFTASCAFGKSEMFSEGGIYLSWPAMENYVNRILDSILPPSLASKKIRAYIGRSSTINAYCLFDGTMVVNAGLLAEVKSEAALAIIMCHELEHFIKNHLLNELKKSLKQKNGKKHELKEKLNASGFSQANEQEADLQGFGLAANAHYDLEEGISNFELFIREQEYYAKRNESALASTDSVTVNTKAGKFKVNTLEKLLSSHPDVKVRKEKLMAYIKANPQSRKSKFKQDENLFHSLQEQARRESVCLLFDENNYQECLERAFIYHLFKPEDQTYQHYIAESTRRLCLLDYQLRKKGFLTEKLVNNGFNEGQGILHDLKYLIPNAENFSSIAAKDLLAAKPPFESYKEALYYFTQKLIDKNYAEAYLTRALFENNKEKINTNISKYLASSKALHREYAINYRDNKLTEKIMANTKEVVLVPRVNYYKNFVFSKKYAYGGTDFYYKLSETKGKELSYNISETFNNSLDETKTISLPQAAVENFNTKNKNETIINRTLLARRDENEGYKVVHHYKELENEDYNSKIDIFRLDPATWEMFNSNGLRTITYANFTRHKNASARKMRNLLLVMAIPTLGFTLIMVPAVQVNYKMLTMYSYDATLGTLYYDYKIKSHGLTTNKARKMYLKLRKNKDRFIKEYNEKF